MAVGDMFQAGAPVQEATGMFASKIQGRAKEFFGTSKQAEQAMYTSHQITGDMMKRSIQQFGMQSLMQGEDFWVKSTQDIHSQLKQVRDEAIRARAQGDMDSYRRALQRQTELEQMAAESAKAQKANFGRIFTAVATAVMSVAGAIVGTAVAGPIGGAAGYGIGQATGSLWGIGEGA